MLSTAASAPARGTPPTPPTCTSIDCPGPSLPVPSRVSKIRAGTTGLKQPSVVPVELALEVHPATSTTTSTVPSALERVIMPFWPVATSTRLATVWPLVQLRFDASGLDSPLGYTVR